MSKGVLKRAVVDQPCSCLYANLKLMIGLQLLPLEVQVVLWETKNPSEICSPHPVSKAKTMSLVLATKLVFMDLLCRLLFNNKKQQTAYWALENSCSSYLNDRLTWIVKYFTQIVTHSCIPEILFFIICPA